MAQIFHFCSRVERDGEYVRRRQRDKNAEEIRKRKIVVRDESKSFFIIIHGLLQL
jgi:hypothetical protein